MMGITFSRPSEPRNLLDVLIAVPQVTDDLKTRDLRALCMVSKDIRSAVDHPAVWRCQFARIIGTRPSVLRDPGMYGIGLQSNPFKLLCQGIHTARHIVQDPGQEDAMPGRDALSLTATYGYLREFYPQSSDTLARVVDGLRALEARGQLPENFWEDIAIGASLTTLGAAGVGLGTYGIYAVPVHVVAPPTARIAALVASLGTKGSSIYLYSVYGLLTANSAFGLGLGVYCTVDTLGRARRQNNERKDRVRALRIQDLVAEHRQVR